MAVVRNACLPALPCLAHISTFLCAPAPFAAPTLLLSSPTYKTRHTYIHNIQGWTRNYHAHLYTDHRDGTLFGDPSSGSIDAMHIGMMFHGYVDERPWKLGDILQVGCLGGRQGLRWVCLGRPVYLPACMPACTACTPSRLLPHLPA